MAYTTNELISRAYWLSGIVSREFETVGGSQFEEGLSTLNDILGDLPINKKMVPYYTSRDIAFLQGVEEYDVPGLIEIDTITFFKDNVRYSMREMQREDYFGSARTENVESLPFNWHIELGFGGGRVFVYFLPDQGYVCQIWGKFRLTEIVTGQDLSLTLDRFYINYLKYALACRLCENYSYVTPPSIQARFDRYEHEIAKKSAVLDLTEQSLDLLTSTRYGLNMAQANIGKGWTAPS